MSTQTIQDIYSRDDAMREACRRYSEGNSAGNGYEIDAAALADAARILGARNNMEVDVYLVDGEEVAVADVHGLWAVTI